MPRFALPIVLPTGFALLKVEFAHWQVLHAAHSTLILTLVLGLHIGSFVFHRAAAGFEAGIECRCFGFKLANA